SGNHHRLDFMIGPGKSLDTNKYFIICTDAIANGLTTSPSNSTAQPRMQFPKFVIRDMVTSQHRLLTEHLASTTWSRSWALQWAACKLCSGASAIRILWTASLRLSLSQRRQPGPLRCSKRPARQSCSIQAGIRETTHAHLRMAFGSGVKF